MLAVSSGGVLQGARVAVWGGGSQWLVRGLPWQMGAAWLDGVAFYSAVRVLGTGRLVGVGGEAAQLLCGLCGGFAPEPVDSWAGEHPMLLAGRVGS